MFIAFVSLIILSISPTLLISLFCEGNKFWNENTILNGRLSFQKDRGKLNIVLTGIGLKILYFDWDIC